MLMAHFIIDDEYEILQQLRTQDDGKNPSW